MKTAIKERDDDITKMESSLKSAMQDKIGAEQICAIMKKEWSEAIKAKDLAVSQATSIEYEYDQYKIRAKTREKELVERLDDGTSEILLKQLQDQLADLETKLKTLETENWTSENARKELAEENQALKGRVEKLAVETPSSSTVKELTEKLLKLQTEYDESSVELVDTIQENEYLKSKCDKHDAELIELKREKDDLTVALNSVSKNLEQEHTSVERLALENTTLSEALEKSQLALQKMTDKMAELKKINSGLSPLRVKNEIFEIEVKETRQKILFTENACQTRVDALQSQLDAKDLELAASVERQEKLLEEISELKSIVTNAQILRKSFDALCVASTRYVDNIKELEVRTAGLRAMLTASETEVERLTTEIDIVNGKLATMQLNNEDVQVNDELVTELQSLLKEAEDSKESVVSDCEQKIVALQAEHTQTSELLQQKIQSFETDIESLQAQLAKQKIRCDELEHEKGMLEHVNNNCRINIQLAHKDLLNQRNSLSELEYIVKDMQLENVKLAEDIEIRSMRESELEKNLATLNAAIIEMENNIGENDTNANAVTELQRIIEEKTATINDLKRSCAEMETVRNELNLAKTKVLELEDAATQLGEQKSELQSLVFELEMQCEEHQKSVNERKNADKIADEGLRDMSTLKQAFEVHNVELNEKLALLEERNSQRDDLEERLHKMEADLELARQQVTTLEDTKNTLDDAQKKAQEDLDSWQEKFT